MKDKKVKKIIVKLINDLHFELTQDNKDRLLNQAINAIKPKIDEGKLVEVLIKMGYGLPSTEEEQKYKDIAHQIALKKDEWLK